MEFLDSNEDYIGKKIYIGRVVMFKNWILDLNVRPGIDDLLV